MWIATAIVFVTFHYIATLVFCPREREWISLARQITSRSSREAFTKLVLGIIWCDRTADWVIRLAPAQSYLDRGQLLTRVDRSCASETRGACMRACVYACICTAHMHACIKHQVEPVTASLCFPTNIPRGAKKTKRNRRRANPLRSHPARNALRLAPTSDTQSRGEPPPTAQWKSWKIVICTPVTRRFRPMIHRLI